MGTERHELNSSCKQAQAVQIISKQTTDNTESICRQGTERNGMPLDRLTGIQMLVATSYTQAMKRSNVVNSPIYSQQTVNNPPAPG